MTGQWVRGVGPGRRNCKLGCGPIFRVMWAVSRPLAEIRFLLDGYQRRALASLVWFWRRRSIKNPPIPITLSFVSSLTDRDSRQPLLRRLDNYVPVHSLPNHPPPLPLAVPEARRTSSFAHHGHHHCHHHAVSTSTVRRKSSRSDVLTLSPTATRPSRVSIIPQTTTKSSMRSQSTMYNSTGPSASGRYAHPPRPSSRPRDPEICDSNTHNRPGTSGCKTTSWRRAS